jgi:hypothetical protein
MTQPNKYVLESEALNPVQRIIDQNFFLKSGINFIRQFFYQTEFKPISQRQFKNLKSDAYFEYTSCYFKVVTLFLRISNMEV